MSLPTSLALGLVRGTPCQGSKVDSDSAGCPKPSFGLCANMHAHTCTYTHTVFLDTIGLASLLMLFISQDLLTLLLQVSNFSKLKIVYILMFTMMLY